MPSLTRYYKTHYPLQVRNMVLRALARCGPPVRQSNKVILFCLTQNSLSLHFYSTPVARGHISATAREQVPIIPAHQITSGIYFLTAPNFCPQKREKVNFHISLSEMCPVVINLAPWCWFNYITVLYIRLQLVKKINWKLRNRRVIHSFCHKFSWIRSADSVYFLKFAEGFAILFWGERRKRESLEET